MSALNPVTSHSTESWCRVSAIADLAEIFDPAIQVCSWQRTNNKILASYLADTSRNSTLQIREVLNAGNQAQLTDLPAGEGDELLRDDVSFLAQILCDLVDCPSVGLRYASVENAMCPRWHIDQVPIRMLCTYAGTGTEWLDNQSIDKRNLSDPEIVDGLCQRATSGDVVLLKGALWQNNEGLGAIHRSPAITPGEPQRMLLTLDPLWTD